MCMECRANAALAKAIVKQEKFPHDRRNGEEIWWAGIETTNPDDRLVSQEVADDALHRAYEIQEDLDAQGLKIVER